MKVYSLIIRRNRQEEEIITLITKGRYMAIKQAAEYIQQYTRDDFDIFQIRLEENKKLVCKFIPFTITENTQQRKQYRRYSIAF